MLRLRDKPLRRGDCGGHSDAGLGLGKAQGFG